MNWLDIAILAVIALLVIRGVMKGFIISFASLVALALGIYAAVHFSNYIEGILVENLSPSRTWLPILSFSITFLAVVILVMIIAKALEKIVNLAGMGIINHIFGGIFGLAKGILLVSVLLFITVSFDKDEKVLKHDVKEGSMLYGYASKVFPYMMKLAGGEIKFPPDITNPIDVKP
jgi:membrane protein required for colicin V production